MGSTSLENLPSHLLCEILMSGRLVASDLVSLEMTSKIFGVCHSLNPPIFRSLVDFAAFRLCEAHDIYDRICENAQRQLFDRCSGNWIRVLRFLQSIEQSSNMVKTSTGNHILLAAGRYHTMLISDLSVYSCGSCSSGVLGHGLEKILSLSFKRISFPLTSQVVYVSACYKHSAFIMQSGEVFTCGDNSSFCCGHGESEPVIYTPRLVEALNGVPCKKVATGLNFTVFLTRNGQLYTCGTNEFGQLGHGDTMNRPIPTIVDLFESIGSVVQIAASSSYALVVTSCGDTYSFGSGLNFCLGHGDGEYRNELEPREIEMFKRNRIHILSVSAGEQHAVALDSNGHVYSWGLGYSGPLGHGDESACPIPQRVITLENSLAVQVSAGRRRTFVVTDNGRVHGFGWTAYGGLGILDGVRKITTPKMLKSLRAHRVSQVSSGEYNTIVVTKEGQIIGFGYNGSSQLGLHIDRVCPYPTQISVQAEANSS